MSPSCRICGRPLPQTQTSAAPFCSERCRLVDLGSWASGAYALPAEPVLFADEEDRLVQAETSFGSLPPEFRNKDGET